MHLATVEAATAYSTKQNDHTIVMLTNAGNTWMQYDEPIM